MTKFDTLIKEIKEQFPEARTDFQQFDLGGATLGVFWNDKQWNLDYQPRSGFGVVEVEVTDDFSIHYDFMSSTFEEAHNKLFELLCNSLKHPVLAAA